MKMLATLLTGTAALALSACSVEETPADDDTDVTVVEPTATETTVVREGEDDDSVTVSDDGVSADVDSGNTRIEADEDGASVTVSE